MKTVRFDFRVEPNSIYISIDGDYQRGDVVRSEGGKVMRLRSNSLHMKTEGIDTRFVHNDLAALISVLAFHPVLPAEEEFILSFSFPVSENFEKAVQRPYILPKVQVISSGRGEPYRPRRTGVLSYGGGFDSLAAHILLPDYLAVHQTPSGEDGKEYVDVVNSLLPRITKNHETVFDNMRTLYTQWGLPLWVSVYAASLLFSPRYIFSGSELTGTYLDGGKGYRPRHRNRWYEVFNAVGVNILPTSFLSEVGNSAIVSRVGMADKAAYCAIISKQDCGKCTKCLRRRLLRAAHSPNDFRLIEEFERTAQIDDFLSKRPLYYSDIFTFAAREIARPSWVSERIKDLIDGPSVLSFHNAYFPGAFEDFNYPEFIREEIVYRLDGYNVKAFDAADLAAFVGYKA